MNAPTLPGIPAVPEKPKREKREPVRCCWTCEHFTAAKTDTGKRTRNGHGWCMWEPDIPVVPEVWEADRYSTARLTHGIDTRAWANRGKKCNVWKHNGKDME